MTDMLLQQELVGAIELFHLPFGKGVTQLLARHLPCMLQDTNTRRLRPDHRRRLTAHKSKKQTASNKQRTNKLHDSPDCNKLKINKPTLSPACGIAPDSAFHCRQKSSPMILMLRIFLRK